MDMTIMDMTDATIVAANELALTGDIVAAIRHHHLQATSHHDSAIRHAVMAGELLLRQKAAVGHGAWLGWLADNVEFTARTAQRYMNAAAPTPKCDKLSHSSKRARPYIKKLSGKKLITMNALDAAQKRDTIMSHVAFVAAEMPVARGLRAADIDLLRELQQRIGMLLGEVPA
jgi:hypothetical protein